MPCSADRARWSGRGTALEERIGSSSYTSRVSRILSAMGVGTFSLSFNRFITILTTPMLAGPRHCRVQVGEQTMTVHMGLGGWAFKAEVPRASIVEVTPATGPVMAWGAHGWRGRWLVNGSSQGLVRIRIDPRSRGRCLFFPIRLRELTLSLDDPTGFVAAVHPSGH
jgi:hypothetical protein